MLAEDYLRMGVVRGPQDGSRGASRGRDLSDAYLVVGGGVTGITAAIETAAAGIPRDPGRERRGSWAEHAAHSRKHGSDTKRISRPRSYHPRIRRFSPRGFPRSKASPECSMWLSGPDRRADHPRRRHCSGDRVEAVRRLASRAPRLRLARTSSPTYEFERWPPRGRSCGRPTGSP